MYKTSRAQFHPGSNNMWNPGALTRGQKIPKCRINGPEIQKSTPLKLFIGIFMLQDQVPNFWFMFKTLMERYILLFFPVSRSRLKVLHLSLTEIMIHLFVCTHRRPSCGQDITGKCYHSAALLSLIARTTKGQVKTYTAKTFDCIKILLVDQQFAMSSQQIRIQMKIS